MAINHPLSPNHLPSSPFFMSRVVLAMSGGVDSSVAAWLLREEGHEVIGVFMRHGQEIGNRPARQIPLHARKQGCCSAADAADARRVADMLGLPFYVLNFEREFARIVDYFVAQYTAGRTPNPCIVCNTWLKFGKLFEYADSVGAEYVATGHYARLERLADGQIALCRGRDESKDQSYVLFGIRRELFAPVDVSAGRSSQRRNPPNRRTFGLARGCKTRQPGNLLCSRPGSRRLYPPPHRIRRHLGRDCHHGWKSGGKTSTVWNSSPSVSEKACKWPSASRDM